MLEKSEQEQLDKAWIVIRNMWIALVGSLAVYLIVCKIIEDQWKPLDVGFSVDTLKFVLYALSALTIVVIFFIRKAVLNSSGSPATDILAPTSSIQHPAAIKYMFASIVAMALCETIGIYGIVFFLLSKDSYMLYQFITISAIAMFFYRPRKEELLQLAENMKKQNAGRRI